MLVGLQYLRAYAALMVLYFHAAVNSKSDVVFGEAGVDVFFVLSGFLMWTVTNERSRAADFMLNRLKRILPVYWIATFALLCLAFAGLTGRVQPDAVHLLKSLLFVPYQGPAGVYPMLNVGWTLNYEMFFYAVFASLFWMPRKAIPWAMTVIFGVLALSSLASPQSVLLRFYTSPIILEFVVGIWLAVLVQRTPDRLTGALLLLAGSIGLFAHGDLPRFIGYGVPAVACVWGMMAIERAGGVPNLPLLKLAGDASYSIYIWHLFGIAILAPVAQTLPFGTVILLAAGLVTGMAGYYLIERPVLAWTKRRGVLA